AVADWRSACRHGVYGPRKLLLCEKEPRSVFAAHRGYRSGAQHARIRAGDPRRPSLDGALVGRGTRRRRPACALSTERTFGDLQAVRRRAARSRARVPVLLHPRTARRDAHAAARRQAAAAVRGQCLRLSQEDIADNLATGKPFVIRMKVPERGLFTFNDARRGRIEIDWSTVDMQILMKSD